MLKYIKDRLRQPSTILGAVGVVATIVAPNPDAAQAIIALATSLGLIHINENPK